MPETEPPITGHADDPENLGAWINLHDLYQLPVGSPELRKVSPIDICIQGSATSPAKRITRIVPYADGGFAVISPYLPRFEGLAVKYQRDYRVTHRKTEWARSFKYRASDRVKLSLHPDGFAQFSGENQRRIISGRDPMTGEPRGIGVMANPFTAPIYTGPTFGVQVWGLDDYPSWAPRRTTRPVLFEPGDIYFNEAGVDEFVLEGFLFPVPSFLPHVRFNRHATSARRVTLPLWRYHLRGSRQWEFTLLPGIAAPYALVALRVSRFRFRFPSPSGFVLNGPAERGVGPIRWIISAFYPAPIDTIGADTTLDYIHSASQP